jgi:hypothetical protein
MDSSLPPFTASVLAIFSSCASIPTSANLRFMCLSAIICTGRKTISNLIRVAGCEFPGDVSTLNRVFSCRKINQWQISRSLLNLIVRKFLAQESVTLVADDTFMRRYGPKVFARCRHRDAVRSSKRLNAHDWGHRWVVLCVLIKVSFINKPFALPVAIGLYRSRGWNFRHKRKHRTPAEIVKIFLYKVKKWLPEYNITFIGDKGFGSFELAKFCSLIDITIVSRFHPNAVLVDTENKGIKRKGRPLKYGVSLPKPEEVVRSKPPGKNLKVNWYGNSTQWLETCTGTGDWKRRTQTLPIKWIYSHIQENDREDYFYTNNISLTKKQVIETIIDRWPIETMFQETKQILKIQGLKGYCERTILRSVPALFFLYSIIVLLFLSLPKNKQINAIHWNGKKTITFTDMITIVRREIWKQWIFRHPGQRAAFAKLPDKLIKSLIYGLAPCD